ncbi:MAG: hypothetical protein ABSG33_07090 [Candidatus Bathyarchaeia archaeon]
MKSIGKIMVACVFISLMTLTIGCFGVKAQPAGTIVINPDGSVPGTTLIQRQGNIYRFTASIYDVPIMVACNNIVLDGEGFALQGAGGWGTPGVAGAEDTAAIDLRGSNITVQNFSITGWEAGVSGAFNGNSVIDNNITRTENAVAIYADGYHVSGNYLASSIYAVTIKGNNNLVSQNQIVNNYGGVMIYPSLGATITENNFANNTVDLNIGTYGEISYEIYENNFAVDANTRIAETSSDALGPADQGTLPAWDNGSVGNCWSDYAAKYPNATEIGTSGVGDTPYLIRQNPTIIDRYPLMAPAKIQNVSATAPANISKAASSLTEPSPNPRGSMMETALFAALAIAAASCIIVVFAFRNRLFGLQKNS